MFKREDRYVVIKRKHLSVLTDEQKASLSEILICIERENNLPQGISCVVVESDWPEYEKVWDMIERRVAGG